jgi:hypothetical protein
VGARRVDDERAHVGHLEQRIHRGVPAARDRDDPAGAGQPEEGGQAHGLVRRVAAPAVVVVAGRACPGSA